jgi:hypothetical protein
MYEYKYLLFAASSAAIIFLLIATFSINSLASQNNRIQKLENDVVGYLSQIDELGKRSTILCENPIFTSSSGKQYIKLYAASSKDGKVSLKMVNIHKDPVFVINVREVLVEYDRHEDRLVADFRSAPTFKKPGANVTCSETIDPGDTLACELESYYSDIIAKTLENGDDTFIINYLTAELDIDPYYFVAPDLCVRIV